MYSLPTNKKGREEQSDVKEHGSTTAVRYVQPTTQILL